MSSAEHMSAPSFISDDRIAEIEQQGRQARRECRSRSRFHSSAIERKAFERGWDAEQAFDASVCTASSGASA